MHDQLGLFIGGEWRCNTIAGENVFNPATEEVLGFLPHATQVDLDDALESASVAFKTWRSTPAAKRAEILRTAAQLMRERVAVIAQTMTLEQGKPIKEARAEILFAADIIDWYAEEGKRAYGRVVPARIPGARQIVAKEPIGVAATFTPWNFPATLPARKIAGSLAAGCTCIIKPSEETPGTTVGMVRAFQDAGLPPGVLNMVFGVPARVSEHLITSEIVRKVSFTGSIAVGKHLAKLAADGMKRCTFELGGHAPVLVFEDSDPIQAAESVAINKYRNAGQVCISPSRFFVHEAVHDQFVTRFAEVSRNLKVAPGIEESSDIGSLANHRRLEAMDRLVGDAVGRGARLSTGGKRIGNRGYFYEPTVLTDVPNDAIMMREEIFGPVIPVTPFASFDEAVQRANEVPYGLAAYAYTNSAKKMAALGEAIEAGMLGINHTFIFTPETPFGGMKESGYGSEGGIEGLEAYLNTKMISELAL
jgi:succinate-semialdehyde dehydrogenase / glutarate-semialdehyde dehydrogenase